jgi:hypothetical protein
MSRSILLKIRNISDKIFGESQHTFYTQQHFLENLVVYETTWKNALKLDKLQLKIWRVRVDCWAIKAKSARAHTHTHTHTHKNTNTHTQRM